jgi:SpoVK/Ycf46/Vps4 family AAA+-type ATPase
MNVIEKLTNYFAAGQSGLVLTSVEPEEVLNELATAARASKATDNKWHVLFWDAADALTDENGGQIAFQESDVDADIAALGVSGKPQKLGLHETLDATLASIRGRRFREEAEQSTLEDADLRILVVRNFDRHLQPNGPQGQVDSLLLSQTQKIITEGQAADCCLILQTSPAFELPIELESLCEYVNHDLPTTEERVQIICNLNVAEEHIGLPILNATAGLCRSKTAQYVAEAVANYGYANPMAVFRKKALHLAKASKLDVWSPEFVQNVKLWPSPEAEEFRDCTDMTMVQEETIGKKLKPGEVHVRVRYVDKQGKKIERWLDPMPREEFNANFRPERDFYSLKSVVGLTGLKDFLKRGFRPEVPDRAKMKHVLMLGVPGTGKSFTMQCCSGEFNSPLSSMQASNLYSKWLGDTDKILARMLSTVEMIGGILAIDEFQRFLPQSGPGGESGGVENRLLGTLLTWFNNQQSNLVLSAANNISNLPDEITRSGRVDALMFVGFPGRASKDAAWKMYLRRHELPEQELPKDEYWTPADIMSCCRLAELQGVSVVHASRWVTPSYEKNPRQMDDLMKWAENAGCICAETGERFRHPKNQIQSVGSSPKKVTRKIRTSDETVTDA